MKVIWVLALEKSLKNKKKNVGQLWAYLSSRKVEFSSWKGDYFL